MGFGMPETKTMPPDVESPVSEFFRVYEEEEYWRPLTFFL
jgi:hypothetical protein